MATPSEAELIVRGRIATLAGTDGFGWADAIAISAGRVIASGARDDVDNLAGPATEFLDAAPGEVVIPAFTDAHLHLGEAALAAEQLDLRSAATFDEALEHVAARHAALAPGDWLLGFGWQAARWRHSPTAAELDAAAPGRPAFLWSHDHHAAWISSPVMAMAGIEAAPDPADGRLARDADGRATGLLHEGAVRLAAAALPPAGARLEAAIERYAASVLRLGIVAVHDPGPLSPDPDLSLDMAVCARLAAAGRLPIRVRISVRDDSLGTAFARRLRSGDSLLPGDAPDELHDACRVGWLKLFADGALGSRTAALLEPYERETGVPLPAGDRGILLVAPDELAEIVARAAANGIASQIHAIGDAAVRAALDAFAGLSRDGRQGRDGLAAWPRIEHAQLVDPADFPRFAALGVAASVQPSHLATDAPGARAAWGLRAERSGYAYRSLLDAGATLAFGSDAPVEAADPWAAIAYAVRRGNGPAGSIIGPDQGLSSSEALRAACLGPALIAGEQDAGRLTPGSRADLLIAPVEGLGEPHAGNEAAAPQDGRPSLVPRVVVAGGRVV